jgi:hypothetical protein
MVSTIKIRLQYCTLFSKFSKFILLTGLSTTHSPILNSKEKSRQATILFTFITISNDTIKAGQWTVLTKAYEDQLSNFAYHYWQTSEYTCREQAFVRN